MKKLNKLRLKWKIFAFLLGFCALLLAALWLVQTVFLPDIYRFVRQRELEQAMATIEKEIGNPLLPEIIQQMQAERDILIVPTQDFVAPPRAEPPRGEGRREPPASTITRVREYALGGGQTLSLTFHAMIAPVNATVSTLRLQLYVITGAMVLLSVLLAMLIAKRVSRPIEDIAKEAKTLATGDFSARFSGKGFYEILALSETLNATAAELGKVESLRRELLANVSHDLRTPLSLIYGYAEMMSDFPEEITPEQPLIIMEEARRLGALVNDVLDVSRLESGAEKLNIARFNLTASLGEILRRAGELLKAEGYELRFEHGGDVFVSADETKVGRAFYNLLANAVNYSSGGAITVSQTASEGYVRISVTDSGAGIEAEYLPFIWDRYYKAEDKRKRAVTGTGLGLSIVKNTVQMHGGRCGVASRPGEGATFWFEIPAE